MHTHNLPQTPGASTGDLLPIHPLTGLTAIGIVGGRPVWPILGGSEPLGAPVAGQPVAGQPAAGTGAPAGQGAQPNTGQPAAQHDAQGATEPQDVSSLPAWAQKLITDTRAEAAGHRTAKATAAQEAQAAKAQRDAILKAAGLAADGKDAPPDADALAAQLEQQQAVAWTNAVELNVVRTALTAGADGDKLLDSRAFIDSLDAFTEDDVRAPAFKEKLAAHVKAYVEQHPQFKTTPTTTAPGRAGSDRAPGSGGTAGQRRKGLGASIRDHYANG